MYTSYKTPLLAITACLLWSTAFAGIKIGLPYTTPLLFAGIRFLCAGLILIPFWGSYKHNLFLFPRRTLTVFAIAFFQIFLLYMLFYLGMERVSGATGAVIIGASPLFTALISRMYSKKEKLTYIKLFAIATGTTGIALISLEGNLTTSFDIFEYWSGIVMLVACVVASSIGNIIVHYRDTGITPVALNSMQIFLGGAMLLITSLIFEGSPHISFSLDWALSLIWLTVMSAIAFSLWFYLLRQKGILVSNLNLWKFLIPVCGAFLSWLLIPGESPGPFSFCGMAIVAVSVLGFYIKVEV
ncbi:MAG: EamA family transporter [Fibrobacteria bacterium]|nr:EamA family transporter [Fibrobacteria bacterium]